MLQHTYIQLGDDCFQQMVGTSMGTNSGTNIVDFYLVSYELKFMTQLVKKAKWDLLRLFINSIRYLDDLLIINNAYFSQLIYTDNTCEGVQGIYPRKADTFFLS